RQQEILFFSERQQSRRQNCSRRRAEIDLVPSSSRSSHRQNLSVTGKLIVRRTCLSSKAFTLLEVLVALTILGLGVVTLLQIFSLGLRLGARSATRTESAVSAAAVMMSCWREESCRKFLNPGRSRARSAGKWTFKPGEIHPQLLGYPATGSSRKLQSDYRSTALGRQPASSRLCVSPRKRIHERWSPVTSPAKSACGTR